VLEQVDTMRGELSAYSRKAKGSGRVLANTAALSEHLPTLLADFLATNPTSDLDLEGRESPAIAAAIAARDADIGIASQAALVGHHAGSGRAPAAPRPAARHRPHRRAVGQPRAHALRPRFAALVAAGEAAVRCAYDYRFFTGFTSAAIG
jgi:DNA-binding transcriptional LysR family regulator